MTQVEPKFVEELSWKERELPQKLRTKHVHGIHPYLGKYVPQLVDYFLNRFFRKGDTVLDPFVGSGTTVVEANTHSMNSVGIDVSEFNILLCKVKTDCYDLPLLKREFNEIMQRVKENVRTSIPEIRIDDFLSENPITERQSLVYTEEASAYLREWYHPAALYPLLLFRKFIPEYTYQDALKILLSRSARSSRLAPHYQLDFPDQPFTEDYYCHKHARICHPTTNAMGFLERYAIDTYNRLAEFQKIRSPYSVQLIHADSREATIPDNSGVITSPPYVGLIDYHEQHRYAYELLGLVDKSEKEIGAKKAKNSKKAVETYKDSITKVISRVAESTDGPIIFVVNDKFNLYESICSHARVQIIDRLKRKVDRRTGRRSNGDFFEDIIIMKA